MALYIYELEDLHVITNIFQCMELYLSSLLGNRPEITAIRADEANFLPWHVC